MPYYSTLSKRFRISIIGLIIIACVSGCQTRRHSRAYLLIPDKQPDQYKVAPNNVVAVPRNARVRLVISDIKLNWIHEELDPRASFKERYLGLGGKDVWLITEAVSVDNTDPLGLKEQRMTVASSIKSDQESFSFLSLDASEAAVFDQIMKSSYHIKFTIYRVDYVNFKKRVYQASNKSIARLTFDAAEAAAKQTASLAAEEVFNFIGNKAKEPLFFERILLNSGAVVLFQGSFELQMADVTKGLDTQYALYDFDTSQNQSPNALSNKDTYVKTFLDIHNAKVKLPAYGADSLKKIDLEHSYVRFKLERPTPEEQLETMGVKGDSKELLKAFSKNLEEQGNLSGAITLDPENASAANKILADLFDLGDYKSIEATASKLDAKNLSAKSLLILTISLSSMNMNEEANNRLLLFQKAYSKDKSKLTEDEKEWMKKLLNDYSNIITDQELMKALEKTIKD